MTRHILIGFLALALAGACARSSDHHGGPPAPPPPPPDQYAEAEIDGLLVTFALVTHHYETARGQTVISMEDSDPPDWAMFVQWEGDRDPGTFDSSTEQNMELFVITPWSEIWMADYPMPNLAEGEIGEWAEFPDPDSRTLGTFRGELHDFWMVGPFHYVEAGIFIAERMN